MLDGRTGTHATAGLFPPGDVAPGPSVVRAFGAYLERALRESDAGYCELLAHPLALPSPGATVSVRAGASPAWWDELCARHAGARVAFRGVAGRGPTAAAQRVPLTVFDRWDPAAVAPTPLEFDVLAIVTTFNEADVVGDLLARLRADGIRVHLIDNWSTDATFDIASSRAASDPGIAVERFPSGAPPAYFELEKLLIRVEDAAHRSGADWVVHHDADEVRQSPWPDVSLRRALWCVEQFGFNCIDHVVMNFRPVDERWQGTGDLQAAFEWFEFGDHHAAFRQQKAWKPQPVPVRFAATGGHDAAFPGRRVFPYRFLLRHYPIRSAAHGRRKVLVERQGRFSPAEREKGWHVHYDAYSERSTFRWTPGSLHRFTTLEDLDRRLLVERLSAAALPANPFPGESVDPSPSPPLSSPGLIALDAARLGLRAARRATTTARRAIAR
ncbi:MAG: glycosyltransferase family 2 protein [Actinomycetota bacterium]|nr:glycosyltransferase family 2 protein [Actinomycetota bacterium]